MNKDKATKEYQAISDNIQQLIITKIEQYIVENTPLTNDGREFSILMSGDTMQWTVPFTLKDHYIQEKDNILKVVSEVITRAGWKITPSRFYNCHGNIDIWTFEYIEE